MQGAAIRELWQAVDVLIRSKQNVIKMAIVTPLAKGI